MPLAVFSDIHANLEALETAVEHAQQRGIKNFAVLGDSVGYGANPNECLQWVTEHASVNLFGNHERALIEPWLRNGFNDYARQAIEWTETVLSPELLAKIKGLSYVSIGDEMTFTHGSLDQPEAFHYLMSFSDAAPSFQRMQTPVCFVGHTHVPACFCEGTQSMEYLKPGKYWVAGTVGTGSESLSRSVPGTLLGRVILNPGSVGQPRDRDPRLSFGIYDPEARTFEIVRLKYDNQKAAAKIRRAGLPAYLADRLL